MDADRKKLVFLFGAGASVPAGCKTTQQLTDRLIQIIDEDEYISSEYPWLKQLWKLIQQHAINTSLTMSRFNPNYENLIYAIELLEEYAGTVLLPKAPSLTTIKDLGEMLGFNNPIEAYSAFSYALMKISADYQALNLPLLPVQIKGTSAKYMWAEKILRKIIADEITREYDLQYLTPFKKLILEEKRDSVVATTNYDLVLDQFFNGNEILYDDGFCISETLSPWNGFRKQNQGITYLKLHGSLTWFQIDKRWFSVLPSQLAANEVYKCPSTDITSFIKDELNNKQLKNKKYKYEFNNPHLIIGGSKDKKILQRPFIEIGREWLNSLAFAETLVIIGSGASDFHLLQQMRGILVNNKQLDKIICINPRSDINNAYGRFFKNVTGTGNPPYMFLIDCCWDFNEISKKHRLPLQDMLSMSSTELMTHFKDKLKA